MGFDILKISISGESHEEKMSLNLCGLESGSEFAGDSVLDMLERRKASRSPWSTPRIEEDKPVFVAGLEENSAGEVDLKRWQTYVVRGDLSAYIKNENVKKTDYENISVVPRPSHADFVSYVKDGKIASGGGRFSGRLTSMLCIAGGIAEDILKKQGIQIVAYISSIGEMELGSYKDGADTCGFDAQSIDALKKDELPILDSQKKDSAIEYIKQIAEKGDSVGGTVECVVQGLPAGELGDNLYEGLESKISYAVFGVPAIKGVEFGHGFDMARSFGSKVNDAFDVNNGRVVTKSNNNGGINGGISNGMPLTLRVAIKPTPSISIEQQSVNLETMTPCKLNVKGRHDACIVPRAVPCVESAVALAILDEVLLAKLQKQGLKCELCVDKMPNSSNIGNMRLDEIREKIDDIDERICALLVERFDLVKEVKKAKNAQGIAVENKNRESEVLAKIRELMPDELKDYAEKVFVLLMDESKDLQRKL